jgi:hypothetical protein
MDAKKGNKKDLQSYLISALDKNQWYNSKKRFLSNPTVVPLSELAERLITKNKYSFQLTLIVGSHIPL